MADMFTPEKRSAIMGRIRSQGNQTTELRFVMLLRQHRITGWRRGSRLLGRPDFVFPKAKVAVFIDGDFWHGNPKKRRTPKSNVAYWTKKIEGNRRRDRLVNRTLRSLGWTVVRFWESDLRKSARCAGRLRRRLDAAQLVCDQSQTDALTRIRGFPQGAAPGAARHPAAP